MDVYDRIGVPKLINAAGNNTNIGGSLMAPEVFEAMMEAGRSFVDLVELSQKVGAEIARLARVGRRGSDLENSPSGFRPWDCSALLFGSTPETDTTRYPSTDR